MPRGHLNEKTVQIAAVEWLEQYYRDANPEIIAIASRQEAVVRKKDRFGDGRADGLVAARLTDGSVFTASLEAKSSRTFHNISPSYRDGRWFLHALTVGVAAAGIAAYATRNYSDHWLWIWAIPIPLFTIVLFTFLAFTSDHKYYRPIGVIAQVKRYPANEHWIALPADAFNQLNKEQQESFLKDVRREGIGFLRVSRGSRAVPVEMPGWNPTPNGYTDFLSCYARERDLREKLFMQQEMTPGQKVDTA